MRFLSLVAISALAGLSASPAYALGLPIPEPSVLGLLGAVAVAGVIAYRLRKRK